MIDFLREVTEEVVEGGSCAARDVVCLNWSRREAKPDMVQEVTTEALMIVMMRRPFLSWAC